MSAKPEDRSSLCSIKKKFIIDENDIFDEKFEISHVSFSIIAALQFSLNNNCLPEIFLF